MVRLLLESYRTGGAKVKRARIALPQRQTSRELDAMDLASSAQSPAAWEGQKLDNDSPLEG